jgi:methylenetetrahydrofolate reductase (NADPH)
MTVSSQYKTAAFTLLKVAKFEVIPMKGVEAQLPSLPKDAKVSVTCSPSKGIDATLELTRQVICYVDAGKVTPHISARLVQSPSHLKTLLEQFKALGIKGLFIVGGDAQEPAGPYACSYDLVQAIKDVDADLELGITAYPEGHPSIPEDVLMHDLQRKAPYASYMATQMCFDAGAIKGWLEQVRQAGIYLPVQIGIPGVMDLMKLVQISGRIGVGDSLRFLTKHSGTVLKLMTGYKPDGLIQDLSPLVGNSLYNIETFHIYTFNQVERTEEWRQDRLSKNLA